MRKLLHRVAPYARRIRAVADVAGPALHVLLFLPRPRWANRLLLGASAAASVAGWLADAAAGQDGAWVKLDLGPAGGVAADAARCAFRATDRRGATVWAVSPQGREVVIQTGEVWARHGSEDEALADVAAATWARAGGVLRVAQAGEGLACEVARDRPPGRAGAAGSVAGVAAALWPQWRQAGAPVLVALCGPRGSRLRALARHAAALGPVCAGGDGAVAEARALEVAAGVLTGAPGAVRDAVLALRPRLLVVDVGVTDPAAQAAEVARSVASAAEGCAVALLCWTQLDGEQVPLGPCDQAIEVSPVGADEAEGGPSVADDLGLDDDPPAAAAAAALCAAGPDGPAASAAQEAARNRAEAVRSALREVGPDAIRGMPAGFALVALLQAAGLPAEEAAEVIAEVRFRADAAVEDYEGAASEGEAGDPSADPDPDGSGDPTVH